MKHNEGILMVTLLLSLFLCGCSSENPMKTKMEEKIGVNQEITGSYDEELARVCHNGTFVGEKDGDVISFKGIPFAVPPVGDLRWKNPVLAEEGEGVYEAKYFGKSPVQTEWPSELGSYYLKGEDCLTLNVWTNQSGPATGKPVMVFFHGGSYAWGATSDPIYDGHNLIDKYPDVILVSAEYRMGIMGFIDFSSVPGGEEYATSGNLGLLDQVCALEWVQRNIEAFGGDPDNVTIFGEQAGAGSVCLIPLIDGTKGLFKRIIAESGSLPLSYSRDECQNLTQMLLKNSSCKTMEELKALDEEKLIELNKVLNDSANFPERDGVVLPYDLYEAWEDDALADIEILIGSNNDELRYWIHEMGYYTPIMPGIFIYEHGMPFMYENNIAQMSPEEKELAKTFLHELSGKKIWKLTEFYNELLFRIPAIELAARHKGTSYNYYWTMPGEDETLGACHAIELTYVFNNPQETIYTGELYNEELANVVQDMWVNFARCGNPSTEAYTWEPYTADKRMTMVLGEEISMTEDLKARERELIEPLLHHYFNGSYAQLNFFVPQLGRIIVQLVMTLLLVVMFIVAVIKLIKRCRRRPQKGES